MERVNFLLDKQTFQFLKSLSGTVSEHIRRAIDEYIAKLRATNVSASESKRKEKRTWMR